MWRVIAASADRAARFDDRAAPPLQGRVRGDLGKETVEHQVQHFVAAELDAARAADELRAAAEQGHRHRPGRIERQQSLLGGAAARRELRQPRRAEPVFAAGEPRFEQPCQREVHVVAAQHEVIADPDAGQLGHAVAHRHPDQGQVGGAAADVADHQQPGAGERLGKRVAVAMQPVVHRRLGLLEQAHPRQAGQACGLQGERPGALIEGSRHGQHDLLVLERRIRETPQPGCAHMGEIAGAGRHRRDPGTLSSPPQGRIGARRSTPSCDSQLLALVTSRPGTRAPRSSASRPSTAGA